MCGRALGGSAPEPAPPSSAAGCPEAQGHRDEPAVPAPAYTGGIFNLGAPPDKPGANLDYLLEDDEPRSRKGLVVGLVALVLVAGLGYLRWRSNLPWPKAESSGTKNTAETVESPAGSAGPDQSGGAGVSPSPAPSGAAQSNNAPPAAVVTAPSAAPISTAPAPAIGSGPVPAAGSTAESAPTAPAAPAENPAQSTPTGSPGEAPAEAAEQTSASSSAAGNPGPASTVVAPASAPPAAPAPKAKAKAKPLPPPKPEDSVAMGERYLYGRGVPQDCTRGLRYVRPAADQSIPKAMITMGALYATGHCLSRDLPTAYRYFALALRKDPENGALKQNAEMVWGQMTASERQQAIRMTQ